jgi:predicted nucleic acid-binding protein
MNPPSILLDHSFLAAVRDSGDPDHDDAVTIYRALIDDFVEQRCLLVARSDHLDAIAEPELFAAVDTLHVARQHRNAATDLVSHTGVGLDEAITLVLIHRQRIRRVASFDERLAAYEIEVIGPPPEAWGDGEGGDANLDVAAATTPTDGAA